MSMISYVTYAQNHRVVWTKFLVFWRPRERRLAPQASSWKGCCLSSTPWCLTRTARRSQSRRPSARYKRSTVVISFEAGSSSNCHQVSFLSRRPRCASCRARRFPRPVHGSSSKSFPPCCSGRTSDSPMLSSRR